MKHSFFNRQDAAVTLLYSPKSIAEAVARAAQMDGADAVALRDKRRTALRFPFTVNDDH